MKRQYFTHVEGGRLKPSASRSLHNDLLKYFEGQRIMITIEKSTGKRSLPQNAYYWGCVIPLVQDGLKELGHDVSNEDVHSLLKTRFNYKEIVNEGTGEVIKVPDTTTQLSKTQFGEYIDKIKQFAAEFLQVNIPDPGEQITIDEAA